MNNFDQTMCVIGYFFSGLLCFVFFLIIFSSLLKLVEYASIKKSDLDDMKKEIKMMRDRCKSLNARNKELQERIEYLIKNEVRL